MKFVALALALLLAVGSNAASLQADAPSPLQQIRSAVLPALGDINTFLKNSLVHLDGTNFEDRKAMLEQGLDQIHQRVMELQASAAPYTDAVFAQVLDATATFREKIENDITTLHSTLQPQREKLWETIVKHAEGYRTELDQIYKNHETDMKSLQDKLTADMVALHAKIQSNMEETKGHMMPIVEAVRTKINENLMNVKEMVAPYVQEYKEQIERAFQEAQEKAANMNTDDLKTQALAIIEQVKAKIASE